MFTAASISRFIGYRNAFHFYFYPRCWTERTWTNYLLRSCYNFRAQPMLLLVVMFLDSFGIRCFKQQTCDHIYIYKQTNWEGLFNFVCKNDWGLLFRNQLLLSPSTCVIPLNSAISNHLKSSVIRRKEKAFVLVIVSLITCYGSFLI